MTTTKASAGSTTTPASALAGRMVVARFQDGRMLKGTTQDFAPNRGAFHVYPGGNEGGAAVKVQLDQLKAVLYVKSFDGDPDHQPEYDFDKTVGHGRKAEVTFHDGEVVAGFTMGYHADRPGFFLIPADEAGNNARMFVVNRAVKSLRWL